MHILADFIPSVALAHQMLCDGGNADLLYIDELASETIINALLPRKQDLIEWVLHLSEDTTSEMFEYKRDQVARHSSTVAFALHQEHEIHSCNHFHILSTAQGLDELHFALNGGSRSQIRTSAVQFLDYMDFNSDHKHSLTGIHFGPAAPAEVRLMIVTRHLQTRRYTTSRNPGIRTTGNLLAAFDVAEFAQRYGPQDGWQALVDSWLDDPIELQYNWELHPCVSQYRWECNARASLSMRRLWEDVQAERGRRTNYRLRDWLRSPLRSFPTPPIS